MKGPNAVETYTKNHRGVRSDNVILTVNSPIQPLPSGAVPDGVGVVIRQDPGNPINAIILVDGTKTGPTSYPLTINDSVVYYPEDTSEIWVGARTPIPAAGLIVCFTHEIN